jgi:putative Mg2+ transporter-C (MgtC) family protein
LAALGFLIGVETELPGQAAEEGTHALVALGAAAFALISARDLPASDTAGVAAGLVTGIGLLGVGVIVKREGERIEGLATTAGMWAVGPIGVAMGAGMYLLGTVTAALVGLVVAAEGVLKLDQRLKGKWSAEEERVPDDGHAD